MFEQIFIDFGGENKEESENENKRDEESKQIDGE